MELKVAAAVLNQSAVDWKNNLENIKSAIILAKANNADLLVLPELCICGYGCEDLFLGDWIYKKSLRLLEQIREHSQNIAIVIGLPYKYKKLHYNTAALLSNGEILGIYAKEFLANDGIHYEPRWFSPWPEEKIEETKILDSKVPIGEQIFEIKGWKIGIEICEDAWRKGRPATRYKKQKVDLIVNPSASHFSLGKSKIREKIVIDSSEKYKCNYLYVNLLGNESGRVIFDGELLLADRGNILFKNTLLSGEDINYTDFILSKKNNASPIHVLEHDQLKEFSDALTLGLFDYLRKSKSRGFVLSLSGGADSSICAVMVALMVRRFSAELGWEVFLQKIGYSGLIEELEGLDTNEQNAFFTSKILTCVYQGTKNSSDDTYLSAKELAESIGATFYNWSVDDAIEAFQKNIEKSLRRSLTWEQDDIALQNIQSRTRSPGIWMLANINSALLIATSNRSEGDVGYTTMDGDTSGSIAPIAGIDKPFIQEWLKYAEFELGFSGLKRVNSMSPTAELRPKEQKQSDEVDLMPYPLLKAIERCAVKNYMGPVEVFKKLSSDLDVPEDYLKRSISKWFRLWARNQWKRERFAPSFHLDDFNIDPRTWYRFPILSGSFEEELEEMNNL